MPDWKLLDDYAFTKTLADDGWAWEFLRRNSDYRKEFAVYAVISAKLQTKYGPITSWDLGNAPEARHYDPEKLQGETDFGWQQRCIEEDKEPRCSLIHIGMARRWALQAMADPEIGMEQGVAFLQQRPLGIWYSFELVELPQGSGLDGVTAPTGALVYVDLKRDITPQLKRLKPVLIAKQKLLEKNGELEVLSSKARRNKWLAYLRILDGYEAGVAPKIIAQQVFPHESDEAPAYNARKHVTDAYDQAMCLVDNGYLNLID